MMKDYLKRKILRPGFYLRGALRECAPGALYRRRFERMTNAFDPASVDDALLARVNYYNKLTHPFVLDGNQPSSADLSLDEGSYYYFDLREYLKYFPPDLKIAYRFGDNILIPPIPTLVKSRPIGSGNENAVVLKLDKLRHYDLFTCKDSIPFRKKRSRAVWRGVLNNPARLELVNRFANSQRHDIGYVKEPHLDCKISPCRPLSVREQLQNRYVISIEGNDVATNLKWIFASRSLCLMPQPSYETWYMEGALQPGVHYGEVRLDFADLEEKTAYFDEHPDEAEYIIANANQHHRQFLDKERETLISSLVLEKYFELSGQIQRQIFSGKQLQTRMPHQEF